MTFSLLSLLKVLGSAVLPGLLGSASAWLGKKMSGGGPWAVAWQTLGVGLGTAVQWAAGLVADPTTLAAGAAVGKAGSDAVYHTWKDWAK